MDWLIKFSASEGTRFFWQEARRLFRVRPLDSVHAAEQIFAQLDPVVQALIAEEGSAPAFIAHARLALAFWDRVVAHRLTPEAAARVRLVPMASFPEKVPQFLTAPWLIEVEKPLDGERLYGDTTALGCYPTGEAGLWMLIGWMIVDGEPRSRAMYWAQNWTRGPQPMLELFDEGYEWHDGAWVEAAHLPAAEFRERCAWFQDGVRFATVLAALLEADDTFLRTSDIEPTAKTGKRSRRKASSPPRWTVRHVTLGAAQDETAPAPTKGTGTPMATDGLAFTEVPIREYLRLQRCGPGNQERRWVLIKAHVSHRWTSSNPKRIVVDSE